MKIRVLIADDHPVVRMGLKALVDAQPDMEVVGEANDGREAVELHAKLAPHITLMDLRMPGMDGTDAIAAIRKAAPEAHIIVLTTFDGDEDIYRAVQAGARGYLLKGAFADGMLAGIRSVHAGERLFEPEVAARLAQRVGGPTLSARESEVLELVAKGLSNKEVGSTLFVSEDTVKSHLKRIYVKLEVTDRTEAVLVAIQRGIIRPV